MKKRQVQNNFSVYAVLGILNCCLIVMFAVVLYPKQQVVVATIGSIVPMVRQDTAPKTRLAKQGVPTRVVVPSVAIDLTVKPGSYEPENQTWTIDGQSAFYADRTVPANTSNGTTLLYGHGTWSVFGRIPDISEGAEATVHTDTGLIFTYVYQSSWQVLPNDTSVLTSDGPPMLILQTCSGAFDKYRTLVAFQLVRVTGYE